MEKIDARYSIGRIGVHNEAYSIKSMVEGQPLYEMLESDETRGMPQLMFTICDDLGPIIRDTTLLFAKLSFTCIHWCVASRLWL